MPKAFTPGLLLLNVIACDPGPQNTGICGEWLAVTIEFEATVWDSQLDEPVEGAELYCDEEDSPRATSDADGVLQFTLETSESPGGCGYGDCNSVTIEDALGELESVTLGLDAANGETIELAYGED
jgi:hypothetical protein